MPTSITDYLKNNFPFKDPLVFKRFTEEVNLAGLKNIQLYIQDGQVTFDGAAHHANIKLAECEVIASFMDKHRPETAPKESIHYFSQQINFFTIKDGHLHLDGLFETHENASSQKEVVHIQCELKVDYVEFYMMTLPIEAVDLLSDHQRDKDGLFSLLCETVSDEHLSTISKADCGYDDAGCFSALKHIARTKQVPKSIEYSLREVLSLTAWGLPKSEDENIEIAFSLTLLLTGDYQIDVCEDPDQYWVTHLFACTSKLEEPYQKALLDYYLWIIHGTSVYERPIVVLYYLIIATMISLKYPIEVVTPMLSYLKRTDCVSAISPYAYFPENHFPLIKSTLEEGLQGYAAGIDFKEDFLGVWSDMKDKYLEGQQEQ